MFNRKLNYISIKKGLELTLQSQVFYLRASGVPEIPEGFLFSEEEEAGLKSASSFCLFGQSALELAVHLGLLEDRAFFGLLSSGYQVKGVSLPDLTFILEGKEDIAFFLPERKSG